MVDAGGLGLGECRALSAYSRADGSWVQAGEAGYDMVRDAWHDTRATQVLSLARPLAGMRVLEVGCGAGRTLSVLKARTQITAFGVEADLASQEQARRDGIECHSELEGIASQAPFDRILVMGLLERVPQPGLLLLHLRELLARGGRLLVEVANLYEPRGLLETSLFLPWRRVCYSRLALEALLRSSGFVPERVVEHQQITVVAESNSDDGPRPFERTGTAEPAHTGMGVAKRLAGYEALERLRLSVFRQGPSLEVLDELLKLVQAPTLERHLVSTLAELVQYWVQLGSPRAAHLMIAAALSGPHSQATREELSLLAGRVAESLQP